MHQDDHLQGILFSRRQLVDLAQRKRHERMLRKMLATKQRMQGWLTKPQSYSPLTPPVTKEFIVVRGGKHRHADIHRLARRFKDIDQL
jgi:hypothetical protein